MPWRVHGCEGQVSNLKLLTIFRKHIGLWRLLKRHSQRLQLKKKAELYVRMCE